ncbi:MAG TPA: peroxiredoxin, partial [Candidatus Eisenbacteria bacterium]
MATSLLPVIGKPAPDFSLPSTTGENVSLKQFKGKKTVVLYFYPKDETPGCTREACDFRDYAEEFEKNNVAILGVSTDNLESHQHFRDKQRLPFPLLSDEDAAVSKLFGVYKLKNLYGKKYMGI